MPKTVKVSDDRERIGRIDFEIIAKSQPSDYRGDTQFAKMRPSERLAWLDLAVDFVSKHGKGMKKQRATGS